MRTIFFILICQSVLAQGYYAQGGMGVRVTQGETQFVTEFGVGYLSNRITFGSRVILLETEDIDIQTGIGIVAGISSATVLMGITQGGKTYVGWRLQLSPHVVQIGREAHFTASFFIATAVLTPKEEFKDFIHTFGVNLGYEQFAKKRRRKSRTTGWWLPN